MVFIPGTIAVPNGATVAAPVLPGIPGSIPVPPFPTAVTPTVLTTDTAGVNGLTRIVATPTPPGLVTPGITAPGDDYVALGPNSLTAPGGLWLLGGDDTVIGSVGNQRILGNAGNDVLLGSNDQDKLSGGQGSDVLVGYSGRDLLLGNLGSDDLIGEAGNDTLRGGQGGDGLSGGGGNDWLFGDYGQDALEGGAGSDVFVIRSNEPNPLAGVQYVDAAGNTVFDPGIAPTNPTNPFFADVIEDFNPQQDLLGLDSGVVYANLRFDTGQNITGGSANDTIIFNNLNGHALAVLEDYTGGVNNFDVITLTPGQQGLGSDFFGPFVDGTV